MARVKTGVSVPAVALPDVVSLYTNWSIVLGGRDPLTPVIVRWLYYWLSQIDPALGVVSAHEGPRPFNGELKSEEVGKLAEDLKTGLVSG